MSTYTDDFGNIHHEEAIAKVGPYSVSKFQLVLAVLVVAVTGGIIGVAGSATKLGSVTASITERSRLADDVKKHCDLAEASSKGIESLLSETGAARLPDVDAKAFVRCSRVK